MDYRAIDFLNNFDEETRKHIIEFGKRISSKELESEVFLVMARKAICFIDYLCEVKLASLNGYVVADRILDMDTEWLKGKSVTVIDDALISGTTLRKTINKLIDSGVSSVKVFVLSINQAWYNSNMLTDSNNSSYLAMPRYYNINEKCMQMCYDIVKALSTIPRPYDIDFPLYGEYSIEKSKLVELLNTSWTAFNVTSYSHISNSYASRKKSPRNIISEYESISFIPPKSIIGHISELIGIDFQNSCVFKVRSYIRKRTRKNSQYSISFLPIVIFNELSLENINSIINHLFPTIKEQNIIEHEMTTYESKFRLIQYVVATFLLKIFFDDIDFFDENALELIKGNGLDLPILNRLYYIFTPKVANLILDLIKKDFTYVSTLSIISGFLEPQDDENVASFEVGNFLATNDVLSSKFMELYETKEVEARALAKKYGKQVFDMPQYRSIMLRLEEGYTFKDLTSVLDGSAKNDFIVSIFLDLAVDTGIAVPITSNKGNKIVRAYRHGEDVIFSDVEAKQITYMLGCFLEISKRKEIPALLLEKLFTTFIRFGLHDSIFEKYDYKNIHSQQLDYIKIAYYIHGSTARVANSKTITEDKPIITSDTKSRWLRDVLVSKELLKEKTGKTEDSTTYYIENDVIEKLVNEHQVSERGKIAKRIARVIGYLYNKRIITERDLILLNASFGHDQIIPALLAEIQVILDQYSFFKYSIQNSFNQWHAMKSIVSFRKSSLFIAQNSGFMKLNSYFSNEPREIIQRVADNNPGDFETEYFYDEFQRYWNEKLSNVKEEVPANIERLINLAAVFILQYGLLYRAIELIIFYKDISVGVQEYFNNLRDEIKKNNAVKRSDILMVINEYKTKVSNPNISAYFQIIDFDINSNTIKNDELIQKIINGIPLIDDIKLYIRKLKRFYGSGNLLDFQQAIGYANSVLNKDLEFDIKLIFDHLEKINHEAGKLIMNGCKYINNRGEIEAPVEYPNLIVIQNIVKNDSTHSFSDIDRLLQERQKKIRNKKNDAELIYQYSHNKLIIMARGQKADEALVNLACHIECTLNYNKDLRIHTILNLNSAYAPYRFESCVASANVITFLEWYEQFDEIFALNSNMVIISELDIPIKSAIAGQLEKAKINSKSYGGLTGMSYNALYLKRTDKLETKSPTKGFTIGVVCAKENERKGILNSINMNFGVELQPEIDKKENFRLNDRGNVTCSGIDHTIIVTKCGQGNTSAANAYASLSHFNPDYIIFVGIAGTCNPEKVSLGDVLLPSEIVDATLKKYENENIQLRAETYRIPSNHAGLIQLFVRIMNERHSDFKLFNGRILSDNAVYACDDSKILESVLSFNDKVDGIEMESAGIYSADYDSGKTKYGVYTIRGVSDNANSVKNDDYHKLAVDNASNVFCELIKFLSSHIDTIRTMK